MMPTIRARRAAAESFWSSTYLVKDGKNYELNPAEVGSIQNNFYSVDNSEQHFYSSFRTKPSLNSEYEHTQSIILLGCIRDSTGRFFDHREVPKELPERGKI